jgi:hypothetical protein
MQEMEEEVSPLLSRLDPGARERLFRGRAPRVKRPVVVADDPQLAGIVGGRRSVEEHPLVAMRVLSAKGALT